MHVWNTLRIWNSWNVFWHSVQNLFPPSFLSKNIKPKTCRTLVLSLVLYGYETWSHTSREEHRLRMFKRGRYLGLKGRKWQEPGECSIMRSFVFCTAHRIVLGRAVAWWLRHYTINRQVTGSIPDGDIGIFQWHHPSGRTMALGSTQPLTEMSTRCISWG